MSPWTETRGLVTWSSLRQMFHEGIEEQRKFSWQLLHCRAEQCSSVHKTSHLLLSGATGGTQRLEGVSQGVASCPTRGTWEHAVFLTLDRALTQDMEPLDSRTSGALGPVSPPFPQRFCVSVLSVVQSQRQGHRMTFLWRCFKEDLVDWFSNLGMYPNNLGGGLL